MSTLHPAPVAATEEKAGAGRHSTCGCATDLEACHVRVRAAGAAGGALALPWLQAWAAAAALDAGRAGDGLALVDEGLAHGAATGVQGAEAELLRLQALLLLRQSHKGTDAVEAAFVAALDSARRSGAGLHDLRVSVSFAGYLFQSGRLREAAADVAGSSVLELGCGTAGRLMTEPSAPGLRTAPGLPAQHHPKAWLGLACAPQSAA